MGRYEAYKNSGVEWIGEIPKGWSLNRAKTVFTARRTKGNTELVQLAATQDRGMIPQSQLDSVVQVSEDADLTQFRTVRRNDFVISLRSFQGGFELSEYEGVCSPAYQVFYGNSTICTSYFKYLFKSDAFISKMNSLTVGIREGKNIQFQDFANSVLAFPTRVEQQAIADYLDVKTAEIDALVADCEREVGLLQEYRKSLITEVMTKGLNPTVPMYDSGIESVGLVPEGWRVYKLRWLCSFHNGDRGANYPSAGDFQDSGIPFYGADALVEDIVDSKQARFITRERYNSMGGLKIQAFDTLYTLRGSTIGKNAIAIDPEGTVASSLIGIRVRNLQDIDPWYLHYWLNSYQEYQQRDACINGSTAPNLSAEDVAQYRIALPPRELQDEMVKAIRARIVYADSLISDKQHMVDKLREYRRSLISEAVTGKFKVPGV